MFKCKECGEENNFDVKNVYIETNESKNLLVPEKLERTPYLMYICKQCNEIKIKATH